MNDDLNPGSFEGLGVEVSNVCLGAEVLFSICPTVALLCLLSAKSKHKFSKIFIKDFYSIPAVIINEVGFGDSGSLLEGEYLLTNNGFLSLLIDETFSFTLTFDTNFGELF